MRLAAVGEGRGLRLEQEAGCGWSRERAAVGAGRGLRYPGGLGLLGCCGCLTPCWKLGLISSQRGAAGVMPKLLPTPPCPNTPGCKQECQHMGIDSSNIRAGLLGLTSELPALAGTAVDALQAEPISQALHYYTAVVGIQEGGATAAAAAPSLLPVLQEVREGRTAPPPRASAAGTAAAGGEAGGNGDLEVDWDLGAALEGVGGDDVSTGDMAGPAGTISWDLDVADLAVGGEGGDAAAPADISWEVEVEALAAVADVDTAPAGGDASSAPAQVSWDIDISGVGEDTTTAEETFAPSSAAAANCGAAEAAAAAAAAAEADEPATVRRLVEDASYRARLLDDLYELRAFLKQVGRCCSFWRRCSVVVLAGRLPASVYPTARAPTPPPCGLPASYAFPQRVRELGGKSSDLLVASAAEAVQAVSADEAAAMLAGVEGALAAWGGGCGVCVWVDNLLDA